MKEEGSEEDAPLALCKKSDAGSHNSNNGNGNGNSPTSCTSPSITSTSLGSTSPFLSSPLSVTSTCRSQVEATLAALGTEVAVAHAANHCGNGGGIIDDINDEDADNGSLKSDNGTGGGSGNNTSGSSGGRMSRSLTKDTTGSSASSRDKVFVCTVCNRSFGYKHVLQNHERTHTGEKPFECKECHKRFTRDHHLKTHMRLHTGEKPYHCTHCDRQFVQVANLRRHLRVHTGERPYHCELCSSKFSDSNQLKAHTLIHRGEKPFQCASCFGRFRRRHHLMHHKCPKDDTNIGKPRRGRRPKSSEALSIVDDTSRPLPTVVPIDRPKRERKSRETRRIIKVGMPSIVPYGEGGCSQYPPIMQSYPPRPPQISTPEQTEPEDLSIHGSDNGDRQSRRDLSTLYHYHHHPQQNLRSSSVPLSPPVVSHHQPSLTPIINSCGRLGLNMSRLMAAPTTLVDDGGSSDSEAMVEEEEVDEEDEEDMDSDSGGCGPLALRRMEVKRGGNEDEDSSPDNHHLHHRRAIYGVDEDGDEKEDGDMKMMLRRQRIDDEDNESSDRNQRIKSPDCENGGDKSRLMLLQHRFHQLHQQYSHHFVPSAHHVVAQNQSLVVVGTGSAVSHPVGVGVGATSNRGTLERQLLAATAGYGGRPLQVSVPLPPQLSGIHTTTGGMELSGSGSLRRQNRSSGDGHGEDFS